MTLEDLPELAKPREVAAYTRQSINAVYDAVNRETDPMPHVRLGPHGLRIPRAALAVWLGLTNEKATEEDQRGSSTPPSTSG